MRDFATRLISHETGGNRSSATTTPADFEILEKLRPQLATLMGNGGFRALLTRALALASAEVPALRRVRVNADGTLDGLDDPATQAEPEQLAEGRVVLLARLLGLMVAFIGENLTLLLLREVWPKVPLEDLDFGNGGGNEETA